MSDSNFNQLCFVTTKQGTVTCLSMGESSAYVEGMAPGSFVLSRVNINDADYELVKSWCIGTPRRVNAAETVAPTPLRQVGWLYRSRDLNNKLKWDCIAGNPNSPDGRRTYDLHVEALEWFDSACSSEVELVETIEDCYRVMSTSKLDLSDACPECSSLNVGGGAANGMFCAECQHTWT